MKVFFAAVLVLSLQACTLITSKNVPGKKENTFSSKMVGKYELVMPSDFSGMMGDAKIYVELKSDRIVFNNNGETNESILNDSLFYTKIGKSTFLSLGAEPNLTVFKMVHEKNEIKLYPMFASAETGTDALKEYFDEVEEVEGEPDESGEPGESSFSVRIVDHKLDKFFSSSNAYKEPFILRKVN